MIYLLENIHKDHLILGVSDQFVAARKKYSAVKRTMIYLHIEKYQPIRGP